MKIISRNIPSYREDHFFSPVREKREYVRLLVESARYLLLNFDTSHLTCNSSIKLYIDKMSRIFFYKEDKYFSISFPFTVEIEGNSVISISSYLGKRVDNEVLSKMIAVLDDADFKISPSLIHYFFSAESVEENTIELLEELFQSEPSYIRYDHDPENENGKLHPLNHLDINYSSYGSYKLGLNDRIVEKYFEGVLDTNSDCSYIID